MDVYIKIGVHRVVDHFGAFWPFWYTIRLRDPKMCSQTKFGIPRIYARDTIILDLMAVVKVGDAPWP